MCTSPGRASQTCATSSASTSSKLIPSVAASASVSCRTRAHVKCTSEAHTVPMAITWCEQAFTLLVCTVGCVHGCWLPGATSVERRLFHRGHGRKPLGSGLHPGPRLLMARLRHDQRHAAWLQQCGQRMQVARIAAPPREQHRVERPHSARQRAWVCLQTPHSLPSSLAPLMAWIMLEGRPAPGSVAASWLALRQGHQAPQCGGCMHQRSCGTSLWQCDSDVRSHKYKGRVNICILEPYASMA